MKFNEMEYKRPDVKIEFSSLRNLINELNSSTSVKEQIEIIDKINNKRKNIETMYVIASIRNSIDTTDEYYDEENDFFDSNNPEYENVVVEFYQVLNNSKFKNQLISHYGEHFFNLVDVKLKTFRPDIIEDLKLENRLMSEYTKLRASAKIMFDEKELNLEQMIPYYENQDQNIRMKAHEATTLFWESNQNKFDEIYDKLVKVRDQMAKKLGFENYIKLGYYRLSRTDYDENSVATYRKQVLDDLVDLATQLREKQKRRLDLDKLYFYDEQISFLSGNATPKGDDKWILNKGKKMYSEISPETNEFFDFMTQRELMDLLSKKGKAGGGYCTFIYDYKSPFIFSNFNGTSGDIDVLTHEAGHAFQCYQSRNFNLPEYVWPTLEACEIHSMSMEFFTYPWMNLFFENDVTKYKYSHLSEAIMFIPYGCLVDEFQHYIYKNPYITPIERRKMWRELEKKYLPHRDYNNNSFYENGGFWFKQGHIFKDPFYYIDYTLAQFVAFQFFVLIKKDYKLAWDKYLEVCKIGGKYSFVDILEKSGLKNPFDEGSLKSIIPILKDELDGIDDSLL